MITFIGLAAAAILILAVGLIFYFSGKRSRATENQQKHSAVGGDTPKIVTRASGRGDD